MLNHTREKQALIRQTIQEIEDAKVKILILEDQLKRIKKDDTKVIQKEDGSFYYHEIDPSLKFDLTIDLLSHKRLCKENAL